MNRKLIIVLLTVLVLITGGLGWLQHQNSFQNLSVTLDPQIKSADIYQSEGEGHVPDSESPSTHLSTSQELRLKKGSYVLVTDATGDFSPQTIYFDLQDKKINFTVAPNYSGQKLQDLLISEQVLIDQEFNSRYPNKPAGYSVSNGQLFMRGEWYGALLVSSSGQDSLRFVMQKRDGKWTGATDPPEIVLSAVVYPGIPKEILQAVNSL